MSWTAIEAEVQYRRQQITHDAEQARRARNSARGAERAGSGQRDHWWRKPFAGAPRHA